MYYSLITTEVYLSGSPSRSEIKPSGNTCRNRETLKSTTPKEERKKQTGGFLSNIVDAFRRAKSLITEHQHLSVSTGDEVQVLSVEQGNLRHCSSCPVALVLFVYMLA